jgi:hypothetical protein
MELIPLTLDKIGQGLPPFEERSKELLNIPPEYSSSSASRDRGETNSFEACAFLAPEHFPDFLRQRVTLEYAPLDPVLETKLAGIFALPEGELARQYPAVRKWRVNHFEISALRRRIAEKNYRESGRSAERNKACKKRNNATQRRSKRESYARKTGIIIVPSYQSMRKAERFPATLSRATALLMRRTGPSFGALAAGRVISIAPNLLWAKVRPRPEPKRQSNGWVMTISAL